MRRQDRIGTAAVAGFIIRLADQEKDRSSLLRFIDGSQAYEAAFEPNRRLDGQVAEEHLARLLRDVEDNRGRMFVSEVEGAVVGWACCSAQAHGVFVKEDERLSGYISEVYVDAAYRGRHIGRALIGACEDHFRSLGLKTVFIGVLSGNARAISAYRSAGFSDYALEMRKRL
jgi:ribosomal protein S18 acetylase RimI-like enzyme